MVGGAEKNVHFLLADWLSGKKETGKNSESHRNDSSLLLPGGRVMEGGRELPEELCWEFLCVGGGIMMGDHFPLSGLQKANLSNF